MTEVDCLITDERGFSDLTIKRLLEIGQEALDVVASPDGLAILLYAVFNLGSLFYQKQIEEPEVPIFSE